MLNTFIALGQQRADIIGTVKNASNEALPGVTVKVKATGQTVSTAANGAFTVKASDQDVLIFTYLGYEQKEETVNGRRNFDIVLTENLSNLDEVVVVGYAKQKKANLTGAVATVSSKDIENRSVTNVSSSLAGLAPGVAVRQGSGRPGSDGATIRIRGTGTLNNNNALVLVDGIIGSMDAVNPNDIESISVLKDAASASIYGSLASNGVILITTKKGKSGKPIVNYSSVLSMAKPSNLPTFVSDYVRHMQLFNEGARNIGQAQPYSQNSIDLWTEANKNPNALNEFGIPNYVAYPNTDWGNEVFENNLVQNHSLSVNGGNENVNFLFSGRYMDNPGLMHNTGLKRYEIRANLEAKVSRFVTLGTQTFANTQLAERGNSDEVFTYLGQTTPGLYPIYEGRFGGPSSANEAPILNNLMTLLYGNDGNNQTSRFNTTVYAHINFLKNLKLESRINYQTRFQEQKAYSIPIDRWNFANNTIVFPASLPSTMTIANSFNKDYMITFDNVLRYNTKLGTDHEIGALVGHNEYYFKYYDLSTLKQGLTDASTTTATAASGMINIKGGSYDFANGNEVGGYDYAFRSYFGRVNYAYKDRYLFEANFRYDGVSRFIEENRWGTFPSFSAGWKLSQEEFMKGIDGFVQNVKLRASWGKLGNSRLNSNERLGQYDYVAAYSGVNYSFNDKQLIGLAQSKYANPLLQWEETTQTDIGIDFTTLQNKMSVELDYYNRYTDGILTQPPIVLAAGTKAAPTRNTAAVLNRGIEVAVGWKDQLGAFQYAIGANFAYNHNVVKKYKGTLQEGWTTDDKGKRIYQSNIGDVSAGGTERIIEGYGINSFFVQDLYKGDGSHFNTDGTVNINGGPNSGMIRTTEDMDWLKAMEAAGYSFSPVNTIGKGQLYYGDFIFADRNGDGIYGNTYDQFLTNTRTEPKYTFGLTLNASYKGFDLSMIWAGMADMQFYWNQGGYNNTTVRNGNAVGTRYGDDHYYYNDADPNDPANTINGTFPRLKYNNDNINNTVNTFWLYNASWFRLKNAQLGYTLPAELTNKFSVSRIRFYFTGENLLTFTAFPGLDPELGADMGYPTMKQFALGVNVSF